MTNVTLLDKARRGRVNAIASLNGGQTRTGNVVSIFDNAFEAPAPASTIEFRSHRSEPVIARRRAA